MAKKTTVSKEHAGEGCKMTDEEVKQAAEIDDESLDRVVGSSISNEDPCNEHDGKGW